MILQIVSILFGGYGLFCISRIYIQDRYLALVPTIVFLSFFWITQALAFDFHNNVLAIGLVPWIFYAFITGRFFCFWCLGVLFLLAKENLGIMGAWIWISLFFYSKNLRSKWNATIFLVVSIFVFIFLIKYIIPSLNGWHYSHWEYRSLWLTLSDSIVNLMNNPWIIFWVMIDSGTKLEFIKYILVSGIWITLLTPRFWALGVLLILQKLLSSSNGIAGFQFHYSAELALVLALSSIVLISHFHLKFRKVIVVLAIYLLFSNLLLTITLPLYNWKRPLEYIYSNIDFSYKRSIDLILSYLPGNVSISASNTIVPHIANRSSVYLFPEIKNSDYVIIDTHSYNYWPFNSQDEVSRAIKTLSGYSMEKEINGIYLYRKNH